MRVLLTGASSFTGSWFARELAAAGHHVVATFRGSEQSYEGIRGTRVKTVKPLIEPVWDVEFGDERFQEIVSQGQYDLFLHHAAEMTDYRSWDFDPFAAASKNTRSGRQILATLANRGCRKLILTGSVFEPYEGVGDQAQRAFNPYGLSKHLTFEWFRLEAERLDFSLGKFVISNPFGPFEEFRFTSFLAREWSAGKTPTVGTPLYIRDNIPASLLAIAYRNFCEELPEVAGVTKFGPSGYIESQASFAYRLAREMMTRTGWACAVAEANQIDFPEPLFRTNDAVILRKYSGWSESSAWDALAEYYLSSFG